MRSPNNAVEATGYRRLTADVGLKNEEHLTIATWTLAGLLAAAALSLAFVPILESISTGQPHLVPTTHPTAYHPARAIWCSVLPLTGV